MGSGTFSPFMTINTLVERVPHLKVPLPSSSLISRLTVKVNKSLSGVSGAACCDDSNAFLADRRNAVAKLYSILLTCRGEDDTRDALSAQTDNSSSRQSRTLKHSVQTHLQKLWRYAHQKNLPNLFT